MNTPRERPYGAWPSPVSAAVVSAGLSSLRSVAVDGDDVYWVQSRPAENGREALMRRSPDGRTEEVLPPDVNTRTRVYEYGGRPYGVADGVVVASRFDDGRLYRREPGGAPHALTPAEQGFRYAAPIVDGAAGQVYCVRERPGVDEPVDEIVAVGLGADGDDEGVTLVTGPDFVSQLVLSPDGRRLAWVQWDHPAMPWDHTEVWVAELSTDAAGRPELRRARKVAGGRSCVSEPRFTPDGERLVYLDDATGWATPYAVTVDLAGTASAPTPTALCADRVEFGRPPWGLGADTYTPLGGLLVAGWMRDGRQELGIVEGGRVHPFDVDVAGVGALVARGDRVAVLGLFADGPQELRDLDLESGTWGATLVRSGDLPVDPAFVSIPEPVSWTSSDGEVAHGLYSAPSNPGYRAPAGEAPPLLVMAHGGPTGQSVPSLSLAKAFWTSRGFAVLDVNYGGSTGFGRAYRDRLRTRWGVVDVADCASGAEAMAAQGRADRARLAITGGSAGGFTTLACLTGTDTFGAGASHFGISDLEVLARDTHKFESRYLDSLVGPYPERADLYRERSPIHHVEDLSCPLALFQGLEDTVVPPNQAELMADAVRAKGLPVSLTLFEGEGHGFRLEANQIRALESELVFYGRVFGFTPDGQLPALEVDNLD